MTTLALKLPYLQSYSLLNLKDKKKTKKQIDCKAGTTADGQNLLANISTSRASLLQGQYINGS